MPGLALKNADNYAVLAVCMQYEDLDCLGTFQSDIVAKRKLPFRLPSTTSRTVEKIRDGGLDLRREDVPRVDNPNPELEVGWRSEAEGGLGGRKGLMGRGARQSGRFRND